MLTCFMNPNILFFFYDKIFGKATIVELLIAIMAFCVCIFIPIGNFVYGIVQFVFIHQRVFFENNKEEINLFKKYALYIGSYLVLTFLLILLFIFDCFVQYYDQVYLFRYYSYIITLLSIGTPVIVGVLRFVQVYMRSEKVDECLKYFCCKKKDDEINLDELDANSKNIPLSSYSSNSANALRPMKTLEFEHFEKVSIKKVSLLYNLNSLYQKYISQYPIVWKMMLMLIHL